VDEEVVADSIRAVAVDKAPAAVDPVAGKAPAVVWVAAVVAVDKARAVGKALEVVWAAAVAVDKAPAAVDPVAAADPVVVADPAVVWVVVVDPVAVDPVVVDPVVVDPVAADPVAADPVAADPVVVDPVAAADPVVAVVVGSAQVPSLPKHGHGQQRTSKPLASTKLSPGNSKSTVFLNSSTRASRPTSMVKKSNTCPP
jgi:hypothetical protein